MLEDLNECGIVIKIVKDVVNGLCYFYSKDIVDRDLKIVNVFVSN